MITHAAHHPTSLVVALALLASLAAAVLLVAIAAGVAWLVFAWIGVEEFGPAPRKPRPDPLNCQHEPPYPEHETVLTSIRDPELVAHHASERCDVEPPHEMATCGEFVAPEPYVEPRVSVTVHGPIAPMCVAFNPFAPSGATLREYQ